MKLSDISHMSQTVVLKLELRKQFGDRDGWVPDKPLETRREM